MKGIFGEAQMDPSVTTEQCWAHLDFCGKLLSSVGFMQTQALKSKYGEEIKRLTNDLLIHAIKEVSFDEGQLHSDAFLNSFGPQVIELTEMYRKYLIDEVGELSMYLQYLPTNELFVQAVADLNSESLEKLGLTEEQAADVKRKLDKAGLMGADKTLVAMKPCDRLLPIIDAGIYAAGGEAEFALIQSTVMATVPKEMAQNADRQPQVIVSTLIASVITAIAKRGAATTTMAVTVQGTIEAVIAAKRVLALPYIASYNQPASFIFAELMTNSIDKVAQLDNPEAAAALKQESAAVEQIFNRDAKKTSTVVEGNGTKN